jgi:hypothetical protein
MCRTRIPRREMGKIAGLPKTVRDRLNQMLLDGVTYRKIAENLGDHGHGKALNEQNICQWRKSGHQLWLKQQERLDDMRSKREFAMDIVRENEGGEIQEASMQIAASQIYQVLIEFDLSSLEESLKDDPENYARIVNALFKLSDGGLKYQRYRAEVALRKANIEKEMARSEPGGITPETRRRIEHELNLM